MNQDALPRCSQAAFESRYRAKADPWDFSTSVYERSRYEAILEALTRSTYAAAFEPGCSEGELTARLAKRCERVLAIDIAPSAAARARSRCTGQKNVEVVCAGIENAMPRECFDLIVFSEIGYYFMPAVLQRLAMEMTQLLLPGGEFIAVHWLGDSPDHVLHGEAVHAILRQALPLQWLRGKRYSGFLIDTWLLA